jgi:hypothetical protein
LTRVEGGRLPDLLTFQKLCNWLHVDPAEMLGVSKSPTPAAEERPIAAAVHLRAEKALAPAAATDLAQLIVIAHRELARRRREGRLNVSQGF